jgi:tryptophan synthase beta chain
MQAHIEYFAGKLTDQHYDESKLAMALAGLPSVPASA